jgi:phenylalanyl-tRNA synthetase beta chain
MTITALVRAANLILEVAGGTLSMEITDVYPVKLEPFKVAFSYSNCSDLIGKDIEKGAVKNIITNLGIEVESEGSDGLLLKVPRYKSDVTREVDVIEEVMRVYGYNNVEAGKSISYTAFNELENFDLILENKASTVLESFGFNEIMCLSLTKETYSPENTTGVKLVNPLSSDLNVMRSDMIFSGLEAIAYNINRKNSSLKLFETGKTYSLQPEAEFKYKENKQLSIFISGELYSENPYGVKYESGIPFLKATLLRLFEKCGIHQLQSSESEYGNFNYGLSFSLNGKIIAEMGSVSTSLLKKMDIGQPVYYACINWNVFLKAFSKQKIRFTEIPKFPAVRRDLALLIDKSVKYREIEELAFNTEKKLLKEVNLFDIYEGEKLGNKKSYAVSFILLNTEATLTDKQIDAVMQKLISGYREKLGAELR